MAHRKVQGAIYMPSTGQSFYGGDSAPKMIWGGDDSISLISVLRNVKGRRAEPHAPSHMARVKGQDFTLDGTASEPILPAPVIVLEGTPSTNSQPWAGFYSRRV